RYTRGKLPTSVLAPDSVFFNSCLYSNFSFVFPFILSQCWAISANFPKPELEYNLYYYCFFDHLPHFAANLIKVVLFVITFQLHLIDRFVTARLLIAADSVIIS
ncbi:hypothetical protein L9F63_005092, partial [Diploptera punctata]